MKPIFLKLILSILIISNSDFSFAQSNSNLDGKSYSITVKQINGKKLGGRWPIDTLKFEAGKMISLYMEEREGFGNSTYSPTKTTTDSIEAINFSYQEYNWGMSLLRIKGTAKQNLIEGTIYWKSNAGVHEYTFSGTLL